MLDRSHNSIRFYTQFVVFFYLPSIFFSSYSSHQLNFSVSNFPPLRRHRYIICRWTAFPYPYRSAKESSKFSVSFPRKKMRDVPVWKAVPWPHPRFHGGEINVRVQHPAPLFCNHPPPFSSCLFVDSAFDQSIVRRNGPLSDWIIGRGWNIQGWPMVSSHYCYL